MLCPSMMRPPSFEGGLIIEGLVFMEQQRKYASTPNKRSRWVSSLSVYQQQPDTLSILYYPLIVSIFFG